MDAEYEVSSYIASVIAGRRTRAYRVWRRTKIGNGSEYIREHTGTIRSIARELLAEPELLWAENEDEAREELRRLAGR